MFFQALPIPLVANNFSPGQLWINWDNLGEKFVKKRPAPIYTHL
jgi:hypothetical protein